MIHFMVLGLPRSGTAWASNWLTDSLMVCHHDPLFQHPVEALDSLPCDERVLGIADTGLWKFPEFLASHPARKVMLHRDLDEVNASLRRSGLPPVSRTHERMLWEIDGAHCDWRMLFEQPRFIYHYLFGVVMLDTLRHSMLCKLNVQADFEKLDPDPVVTGQLLRQMAAALER
jgi:hypothetical protein